MIMRREIVHRATTPDGQPLELAREGAHYVIRVSGVPLMSSATYGSEQAMARIAAERIGSRRAAKTLVGGLGMGYTLRATLDVFGKDARVTVAELLPSVIEFSRGVLGPLADRPLEDRRVTLFQGDVRELFQPNAWDAILLDVDNGPDAFTIASNASLYGPASLTRIRSALTDGGVFVTWSAYASPKFEARLRSAGFRCEVLRVKARGEIRKGANHTLFVASTEPFPKKRVTDSAGSRGSRTGSRPRRSPRRPSA